MTKSRKKIPFIKCYLSTVHKLKQRHQRQLEDSFSAPLIDTGESTAVLDDFRLNKKKMKQFFFQIDTRKQASFKRSTVEYEWSVELKKNKIILNAKTANTL